MRSEMGKIVDYFERLTAGDEGVEIITGWLAKFVGEIEGDKDSTLLTHHFVQLGVDLPKRCDCYSWNDNDPALTWLHRNHVTFNSTLWKIMKAGGQISRLRRVLRDDVTGPDVPLFDGTLGYGNIVLRSYGSALLANFQRIEPNRLWVNLG